MTGFLWAQNARGKKKNGECDRVKTSHHGKEAGVARSMVKELAGAQIEDRTTHSAAKAYQSCH
jgi:hypothetical protein